MHSPTLRISIKDLLHYSLLIVMVAISFLFAPAPKNDADICGQYIHLGSSAGFPFNCDAADYCMAAKNPSRILDDSAVRQSRPLFIGLASFLGHPIQWLTDQLDLPFLNSMGKEASVYAGFYMGYVLINFLSLLISLLLFQSLAVSLAGNTVNKWILLAFQLVLVSNEITKTFFWTAHQQFFSLLTPLMTIWLALKVLANKQSMPRLTALSLFCGVLLLFYGNVVTMFATLLVVAFLSDKRIHFVHLLKNCFLFLLPTALWISYCIYQNGHYYNHEVEKYRQLVWMADSMKESGGALLQAIGDNILIYLRTFEEMLVFVLLAALAGLFLSRQKHNTATSSRQLQVLMITGLICIVFFMFLGFYEERLTYTLLPVCLCIIFLALTRLKHTQKYPAMYLAAAIGWHLYNMLSYGPFS